MLKIFKIIKPIYIILGLFVVVLIVSALGSRTKEGMTSGQRTVLLNYFSQRDSILSDINTFVQTQNTTWGSSTFFTDNLKKYLELYTCLTTKNYYKSKDLNNDGAVVVSKTDGSYIRDNKDNSGNTLGPDEKLYYYDLGYMDKNNDSTIVVYKNTDIGNFFKDNVDNSGAIITANSLSSTPYILKTITNCETVSQTKLDVARALLDTQIALLTSSADKTVINKLLTDLLDITNKIIVLTTNTGSSSSSTTDLYAYDPSYFGSYQQKKRRDPNDYGVYDYYDDYYDEDDEDYEEDDDEDYPRKKKNCNRRHHHRSREDDYEDSGSNDTDNNHGAGYWKNLYLNALNTSSDQRTPLFGSLLGLQTRKMPTSSLVNPSYSSLLSQDSSPGDTGDASSGVGVGTGTSAAGTGTAGMGTAGMGTSAAGISTRSGPVQPATTDDMYLLSSQNSPTTSCPVGGCGASSNNLRPSVVPPCPPCERCPEPKFDCKRVPKYNSAADNQYLPQPVLNDFSQFGM